MVYLRTCSYSVASAFDAHFKEVADWTGFPPNSTMYEYIKIDVHAPVLDLPEFGKRPTQRSLSRAVIQGNIELVRRDYYEILRDLSRSLNGSNLTTDSAFA